MSKLIGTAPNQVPSNADLGTMAYQDYDVVAPQFLAGGRRNLIINGAMQVWQRGTSFASASSGTNADMWRCEPRNGTTMAVDRTTDVPANTNFAFSWKCSATNSTDDGFHLRTGIELDEQGNYQKFSEGTKLILSFWAKKTSAGTQTTLNPVLFLASGINGSSFTQTATRTESNGTLTNDWQRFVFHYTCPTWAAENGSLGDLRCLVLRLLMGSDNTPQDLYLTGMQLEYGTVATPFEYRSYGEELALCQRYYWQTQSALGGTFAYDSIGQGFIRTLSISASPVTIQVPYPVPMRSAPSVGTTNGVNFTAQVANSPNQCNGGLGVWSSGNRAGWVDMNTNSTSGWSVGQAVSVYCNGGASDIFFSAEL